MNTFNFSEEDLRWLDERELALFGEHFNEDNYDDEGECLFENLTLSELNSLRTSGYFQLSSEYSGNLFYDKYFEVLSDVARNFGQERWKFAGICTIWYPYKISPGTVICDSPLTNEEVEWIHNLEFTYSDIVFEQHENMVFVMLDTWSIFAS